MMLHMTNNHKRILMKICVGCKLEKQTSGFYKSASAEDGLNRYCKSCCKVNRSLESVRKRDRRSKMSYRQRYRANQLGKECDDNITLAKIYRRYRGICQRCKKWVQPKHASMDHIVPLVRPEGHHVWSNVQLMHLKCNLRKGDRDD